MAQTEQSSRRYQVKRVQPRGAARRAAESLDLAALVEFDFTTARPPVFIDNLTLSYALSALGSNGVALTGLDFNDVLGGFFVDAGTGAMTRIFSMNGGLGLGEFAADTRFLSYGPDGMLSVLDYGNNRIQRLDPNTGYTSVSPFSLNPSVPVTNSPFAIDSAGNFYFGIGAGDGSVYDSDGNYKEAFSLPSGIYASVGPGEAFVSATPDGTLRVYDKTGLHFFALAAAQEPAMLALLGLGMGMVGILARRRR